MYRNRAMIPDYKSKRMMVVGKDMLQHPVSNLLQMSKVKTSSHISGSGYTLTLAETSPNGLRNDFDVQFEDVAVSSEKALKTMYSNGYVLEHVYADHLRRYLTRTLEHKVELEMIEYFHDSLGFTNLKDGSRAFLLENGIHSKLPTVYSDKSFKFQAGQEADYMKFLENEVLPYNEMKLALTLGLTSVVASDLKEVGDLDTIVLNIFGGSSTGKTTATQFMASLWGNPKISNRGIVRTFNATQNSLIHTLEGINGVPIIIDDATSMGNRDLTSFIYGISAGETKLRMTSNIELRENKGNWSGLVGITAETSILEDSARTSGIIPRLLEFGDVPWTNSGEHARAIKKAIQRSYGHIGKKYVEAYMNYSEEDRISKYYDAQDELEDSIKETDEYSSRIVSKLAAIYMTAKLIEEIFKFENFNSEDIKDYLVQFEESKANTRSIADEALDIIRDFIVMKQHTLHVKTNPKDMLEIARSNDFIGYRSYISDEIVEVTMLSRIIKEELSRHNITQWSNVLRSLEKKEYIKSTGKDNKVSEKDNYMKARAITFRFRREPDAEYFRWYYEKPFESTPFSKAPTYTHQYNDDDQVDDIFGKH